VATVQKRPFEQGKYSKKRLMPTFKDFHYKFTLKLPMSEYTLGSTEPSKPVFLQEDLDNLDKLFRNDFGGFTRKIETPSEFGQWNSAKEIIVNEHAIYEIFTARTREALNYFDELKERLHIRAEKLGVKQDIIVIEQHEITFSTKPSFNKKFLGHLLRRKSQTNEIKTKSN
jgi:hypothetical protein